MTTLCASACHYPPETSDFGGTPGEVWNEPVLGIDPIDVDDSEDPVTAVPEREAERCGP